MKHLMVTWTDIFLGIGDFCQMIFRGMKMMGHGPNVFISLFVIGLLGYWTMRLLRYRKEASRNSTIE
jgi:hypothetical protein